MKGLFGKSFDPAKLVASARAAAEQVARRRTEVLARTAVDTRTQIVVDLRNGREHQARIMAEAVLKNEAELSILNAIETVLRDIVAKHAAFSSKKGTDDILEHVAAVFWVAPRFNYPEGVPALSDCRDILQKFKPAKAVTARPPAACVGAVEAEGNVTLLLQILAQSNGLPMPGSQGTLAPGTGGTSPQSLSANGNMLFAKSLGHSMQPGAPGVSPTGPDLSVPMDGVIRVEERALPLQVAEGLPLPWKLGSGQAPVDVELHEKMTLVNNGHEKRSFRFGFTEDQMPRKFTISFEPAQGVIAAGKREVVDVKLRILCTAHLEIVATLLVTGSVDKVAAPIVILRADSQLSTRLDRDEVAITSTPIGSGAFGTVYRGTYRGLDVAVKVLTKQEPTPIMAADFKSEVTIMEKLRHPCILNFVGAVHEPGFFMIITEFCTCGNLWFAIRNNKFSYAMKIKCLVDTANAMNFLHQSNILHRDIKPENLLVVSLEPRASVVAKLSDFGTTRDVNKYSKDSVNCTKGIGTPLYMAPEILEGETYGSLADVYSFGMMMYVLFAESTPFDGELVDHPWEFAAAVRNGKRPNLPPGCPKDYGLLMEQCWSAESNNRPNFSIIFQKLSDMLRVAFDALGSGQTAVPSALSPSQMSPAPNVAPQRISLPPLAQPSPVAIPMSPTSAAPAPLSPTSQIVTSSVSSSSLVDIMPGEVMIVTDKVVIFEYCYLSQWYPTSFVIKEHKYNCCEQFTQAEKARLFSDTETLNAIMQTDDAARMRYYGRCVKNYDDATWRARIRDVSFEANLAKFRQNQNLRDRLMKTGTRQIGEAVADEMLWGVGLAMNDPAALDPTRWAGQNMLGKNIMNVRAMLSRGYTAPGAL